MRLARRPRLTYANVVSTMALFLALGGGAYAAATLPKNSVGTTQLRKAAVTRAKIKNNAVDGTKVADRSITGADVKESTLTIVPSATHAGLAAGLDKVTYKAVASGVPATPPFSPTDSIATASATCNPGQHVVGGGVKVNDPASASADDGYPDGTNNAWTVRVENFTAAPVGFTVVAICATVTTAG